MKSDLTILCVRPAAADPPDANSAPDNGLESFASGVIGAAPPIRLLERRGDPATEILDAAATVGSDVIVMGTHGRTGLQRLLLGSVTERVVRHSAVPVLAVPQSGSTDRKRAIGFSIVLCAVDFSKSSGRAVEYAAAIAAAAGARLVLAHALEWSEETDSLPTASTPPLPSSEDDAIAGMNRLLTDELRERCAPEFVVGYGPPADELLRVGHERQADLVVLGIRRRNPIDLAVFGSTAQRLIRDGACAVLTVRALEGT